MGRKRGKTCSPNSVFNFVLLFYIKTRLFANEFAVMCDNSRYGTKILLIFTCISKSSITGSRFSDNTHLWHLGPWHFLFIFNRGDKWLVPFLCHKAANSIAIKFTQQAEKNYKNDQIKIKWPTKSKNAARHIFHHRATWNRPIVCQNTAIYRFIEYVSICWVHAR